MNNGVKLFNFERPYCNDGICIGLGNEPYKPEHLEPLSVACPLEVCILFTYVADWDHMMCHLPVPPPQLYRIHNHSLYASSPCLHHLPHLHCLISANPHSLTLSSIHCCFHVPDSPCLNSLCCHQYHCPFSLANATNVHHIDNCASYNILDDLLVVSLMRLSSVEDGFYWF